MLKGKTIIEVVDLEKGSGSAQLICSDGTSYNMEYYPDCCATADIEDICGDVEDILNSEILLAEEVSSNENPEGVKPEYQDSFTWTFYKLSTIKGSITIRWYGESNGYYSESPTFELIDGAKK